LCEHVFVSTKGGSYANLQRAIATGNPLLVRSAAAELPGPIRLPDALSICLVLLRGERASYEAAAVRLHARMAIELPLRELDHAHLTLGALSGLRAQDPLPAAHALAEFFDAAGLEPLRQRVDAWLT
jgi:hypothetical protein